MIHETVLTRIGDTPLVEIRRLNPYPGVRILAKLEAANPGGSIKDRVAVAMIEAAERSGELTPDKTIIEATSGNTGIGLAMVAAIKGYRIKLLMSERASEERKMIVRAYGAEIGLTPAKLATDGAIEEAYRLARQSPDKYVLMDQFNNPASVDAHYNGTGIEIWEQTDGALTHFVTTLGTSGTAMGCTKRLKEMNPDVWCAAVEPYAGHKIQGLKNMHESYPPGIFDRKALDEILHVDDERAFDLCRKLAREEGIFAGMSSGAALGGALQLAERLAAEGRRGMVVTIFPDSGERYLSTPLYAVESARGVSLFDLASHKKTTLSPDPARGLYTIGPSLDNPGGLSAWRRVVLLDVLARHLAVLGKEPAVAVGLADLDDRTLAACRKEGVGRDEFSRRVREEIKTRAAALGVREHTRWPLASGAVGRALDACRAMLARGLAYEKLRSVYFDVFRDERYGEIAGRDLAQVTAGRTVDLDAYVKDAPHDFTLLKRASLQDLKLGDVVETEWGNVRPSWFLQHAAAALESLGGVDVFLGSEAHRFPHLENLRAIWSVAGVEPAAWLVDQPVALDSEADPAAGNLEGLLDMVGNPHAARLWLLSGSYRKPLTFSGQSVSMWAKNWRRVQEAAGWLRLAADTGRGGEAEGLETQAAVELSEGFRTALEDDLSLHRFWPTLNDFAKQANALAAEGRMTRAGASACLEALNGVDAVLGLIDPAQMPLASSELTEQARALVAERETARKNKDFAASDRLRDELAGLGFRVEDTPKGARVYRA